MVIDDRPIYVSIWCATYNQVKYIRQCLDGFVMQKTDFRFEAIVHDDASTDGTADIVREYAEKYPDIIKPIIETQNQYSKKDGSLDRIMIDSCTGKYLAMCEGDDYWTDLLKLQKQVDFLENNSEYVVCTHDFIKYYENEQVFAKKTFNVDLPFDKQKDSLTWFDYSLNNYFHGWYTQPLTALYRNGDYIKQIPTHKYKYYRDYILFYYILKEGKGALLKDCMGVYRINEGGISALTSEEMKVRLGFYNNLDLWRVEKENRALPSLQMQLFRYLDLEISKGKKLRLLITYILNVPFEDKILVIKSLLYRLLK